MAFSQVVAGITKIDSCFNGNYGISLTNISTSAASLIASGSYIVINSAYFIADADVTPNATSWSIITTATTAYLGLTASGTAGSQILEASWHSSPPVFVPAQNGWYVSGSSNIRIVASVYKNSHTSYLQKQLINYGQSFPGSVGDIIPHNGLGWVDNVTKPGWYACTTANSVYGVPALTNKFIMGALTPGGTGGNNSVTEVLAHSHGVTDPGHAHGITDPGHTHTMPIPTASGSSGDYALAANTRDPSTKASGSATTGISINAASTGISINSNGVAAPDNRPAYYAVIYIMKVY